eukprot:scaffold27341_cov33-Phaeocystis_antarctica.AAC.1
MPHRARTPQRPAGRVPGRSCSATHTREPCPGQAALFERLGLLPGGSRHLLKPVDFLEGGKVDRQLVGDGVWLGPQQETVQRPLDSKPHTRVPADAAELKYEMGRLKAAMRL